MLGIGFAESRLERTGQVQHPGGWNLYRVDTQGTGFVGQPLEPVIRVAHVPVKPSRLRVLTNIAVERAEHLADEEIEFVRNLVWRDLVQLGEQMNGEDLAFIGGEIENPDHERRRGSVWGIIPGSRVVMKDFALTRSRAVNLDAIHAPNPPF